MINTLLVVGVGLIGGSVALSLKAKGHVKKVVGIGRGKKNLQQALKMGVIDEISDIRNPIDNVSMILLATPVSQASQILENLSWAVKNNIIITDAGSTKREFVKSVSNLYPKKLSRIVPGHPIAGGERVGVDAASPDLFKGKRVILTPIDGQDEESLCRVESLWKLCGAKITKMGVDEHDAVFSSVSHLPHVLSYALVEMISKKSGKHNLFDFSGGGFKDFTRIAGSSPEMWRDICMANKDFIVDDIKSYQMVLTELSEAIEHGKKDQVIGFFEKARSVRQHKILKKYD